MLNPRKGLDLFLASAIVALGMVQAAAGPLPSLTDPAQPARKIENSKEFARERNRAKTAADFTALAVYCQSRVAKYQADKSQNEAELNAYNSKPHSTSNNPKFQPLDKTLRSYIAKDEKEIARWGVLADQYSAQASRLEADNRQP